MEIEIIILIIIIYLLSIYGAYKFIQLSHYNEKGRWTKTVPGNIDIAATFFPGVNSIFAVNFLLGNWKKESYKKQINFFKPKNNGRDR